MPETPCSVVESIKAFCAQWPYAEFGPAHVVLSDYNLADTYIRWCIGLCRAALSHDERDLIEPHRIDIVIDPAFTTVHTTPGGDKPFMDKMQWYADVDRDELVATIVFLEELLTVPETRRIVECETDA
jgi:hypothetical protein